MSLLDGFGYWWLLLQGKEGLTTTYWLDVQWAGHTLDDDDDDDMDVIEVVCCVSDMTFSHYNRHLRCTFRFRRLRVCSHIRCPVLVKSQLLFFLAENQERAAQRRDSNQRSARVNRSLYHHMLRVVRHNLLVRPSPSCIVSSSQTSQ